MNVNNRQEVNGMNDRWRHKLRALDMMIRAEKEYFGEFSSKLKGGDE